MKVFVLEKKDGNKVSCIKEIPADPKGIVIAVHGFESSRECETYKLLMRRMPAAGLGVVGIDLPGHGTHESAEELLRLAGALDSIAAAEDYAAEQFPGRPICYFGSSFGAYLLGLYLSTREHRGRKFFWRSAAVNMASLIVRKDPTEEEKKTLLKMKEQGYFDFSSGSGKPVRITEGLYHDFETTDLFEFFDVERYGKNRVVMAHGEKDRSVLLRYAQSFANQFDVPIHVFPGEGHSLDSDPGTPDKVADLALELFCS